MVENYFEQNFISIIQPMIVSKIKSIIYAKYLVVIQFSKIYKAYKSCYPPLYCKLYLLQNCQTLHRSIYKITFTRTVNG